MTEDIENINPWAEKLGQVEIPDIESSWNAMKTLRDREMPSNNNDWRRWVLLILLLLLLIGVCNCPGVMQMNKFSRQKEYAVTDSSGVNYANSNKKTPSQINIKKQPEIMDSLSVEKGLKKSSVISCIDSFSKTYKSNVTDNFKDNSNTKDDNEPVKHNKRVSKVSLKSGNHISRIKTKNNSHNKHKKNKDSLAIETGNYKQQKSEINDENIQKQNAEENSNDTSKQVVIPTSAKADSAKTKAKAKVIDSTKNQTDSVKKKKGIKKGNGIAIAAGLGINQFFTVGAQEHSNYNSGGTSGVLSDYIPVPFVRAYINKKLYLQIELQLNTPQYTKKLLAKEVITKDSTGATTQTTNQNSIFIKKLFYFNIPLSVHYSPFKNLYTGAGIQYSRLTNGVGMFDNVQFSNSSPDTSKTSKISTIKNDSVYRELKTSEFRLLLDVNYQWHNIIGGFRYNQAFSKFINVRISSTEVTQARNNSIQLYLRYLLWKNLKAKKLNGD